MARSPIFATNLSSILVAISASGGAAARSVDDPGRGFVGLDEIVVTATRTPQPISRIGSSITVLTREAIQASQTVVVSDLLVQTPGVSFSRNGGVGGTTSLRIRGAETDQTLVVIDGVKLNDPSSPGGGYNFANLLTGDIQRIEILRGAQSTLWGSRAIGGVVNIATAVPTKAFEASAEAEGGTRGTGYGRLGAGGSSGRFIWRLAGGYYTTDGVSAFAKGTEDDGYQNAGLSGRVSFAATDNLSFDLRTVYAHGHNQHDGFPAPAFAFADTAEFTKTGEFVGYAGVNFNLPDGRLKNRAAYTITDTDRVSFNPDQKVTTTTFDANGRNVRWEYQGSLSLIETWNAVFGAEHEKSGFRTAAPSAFGPNPKPSLADASLTSGYAQVQGDVIPNLTLTGGLRYDSHETFGGRALGQAAAAWSLNQGDTILRASFGQGFKAPTLYQLFSVYGNTALRPEQSDSWDGGVEQHLIDDMLTVSATGFYRRTLNQIDFVSCPTAHLLCTAGRFGFYDNTERTKAQGVELAGAAKLGSLTVQANYSLTDTENTSPGNVNRGKDLARRPKHGANLWATYAWPRDVSTSIALRYVGDAFDDAANSFVLEDYAVVDLRAAWRINETVEVYGRVENLLNEIYATARNYGVLRRGAFAGVRARF